MTDQPKNIIIAKAIILYKNGNLKQKGNNNNKYYNYYQKNY